MRRNALLFAALTIPPGRPAIEIGGFRLVESREQKKHLEMESPFARIYKPQDIVALDTPHAKLWGKAKKPYDISGDFGILSSQSEDFTIVAKSKVLGPEGLKILTSNLVYAAKKQKMTSDDPVEAFQLNSSGAPNIKITGMGLIIDLDEGSYEIMSDVRSQQGSTKESSIVIESRHALLKPQSRSAVFDTKVIVSSPQFTLKGDLLDILFASDPSAEKLDAEQTSFTIRELSLKNLPGKNMKPIVAVFSSMKVNSKGLIVELDGAGNLKKSRAVGNAHGITNDGVILKSNELISENIGDMNRISLRGEVTIITNDRTATCEAAEFFPDSGNITLRRIATVKRESQTIEGDIIHFSTKHSEIIVEKARGSLLKPKAAPQTN